MKFLYSLLTTVILTANIGTIQPEIVSELTVLETYEEMYQEAEKITVLIESLVTYEPLGSGVIYKKEGNTYYVLTAFHVIRSDLDSDKLGVKFSNQQYPVEVLKEHLEVLKEHDNRDLAVLKFTTKEDYDTAKVDCDDVKGGSDIYVSGYPYIQNIQGDNIPSFYGIPGRIISTTSNADSTFTYTYKDTINTSLKGISGGPILNKEGCLVGIHIGSRRELNSEGIVIDRNKYTGLSVGIAIKPNLSNIKTMIRLAKANKNSYQANNNSIPPTPTPTPSPQRSPSPDPIPIQSSSLKPQEKEVIYDMYSMSKAQKKAVEDDTHHGHEKNSCLHHYPPDCDEVFLDSTSKIDPKEFQINSKNYNFDNFDIGISPDKKYFYAIHFATPKENSNLKAFVGATFISTKADPNDPEIINIVCFTTDSVKTKNDIQPPTYNPGTGANCGQQTSHISELELSDIDIVFVCNLYQNPFSKNQENQTKALNFLEEKISKNRPLWADFQTKWDIFEIQKRDLFLTNVCHYYNPEKFPKHKEALGILQRGINELPSEVQSEFLKIWNASEE
ncbi:serine protease [Okeania sp. SIO2B3]|uniref:S1 family peptidase n=1 Tax=Okeania sp. SIO2B3 TaxID=2607784 RepID=UPI0013C04086|nr:serine protease [Okeania sp. SIO2B3]NET41696.1 trypsin-like serine protease [Okeania sp. SIO2B3]